MSHGEMMQIGKIQMYEHSNRNIKTINKIGLQFLVRK